MEKTKSEKLYELLEKFFGGSEKQVEEKKLTKAVDEENRTALFVVLEPQEGELTTDLHGDTYSVEDVRKAAKSFNDHCNKANLFHQVEIEEAKIFESYILPADLELDDGRVVKSGSWLQNWYFPDTEQGELLWQAVKAGTIEGVSIQGHAKTESLND